MRCEDAAEFVSALCDGEIIPREAAEHAGACAACQARMREYLELGAELRRAASLRTTEAVVPLALAKRRSGTLSNFWHKGWESMRLPRLAFAALVVVLVGLSLGLVRARVQAHGTGNVVLLSIATSEGEARTCAFSTVDRDQPACGVTVNMENGYLKGAIRLLSRSGDRVKLGVRTKFLSQADDEYQESHGGIYQDTPEKEVDFRPGETLRIATAGAGAITVTGEWLAYMPYFGNWNLAQDLEPGAGEISLVSPVLLRGKEVVFDEGSGGIRSRTGLCWFYVPGDGMYEFSLTPLGGAVEGRVENNRLRFTIDDQGYELLTGTPIARSEKVWVLYSAHMQPSGKYSRGASGFSSGAEWPNRLIPREPEKIGQASTAQTTIAQAGFALEIFNGPGSPPIYANAPALSPSSSPDSSLLMLQGNLHRLAHTGAGVETPAGLGFDCKVKGDAVSLTPVVFYGDNQSGEPHASAEPRRSRTLATHSGKLNDTVAFPEMAQVGLEPITLRILSAKSDYHPVTRSSLPSIQIGYEPVDLNQGRLSLHNLSGKAVSAVQIEESDGKKPVGSVAINEGGLKDLLAPGASFEGPMGMDRSGRMVDGKFVESPPPQYLTLTAALFADDTYEGDARAAAELAAARFGAQTELAHIKQVAEPVLAQGGLDDFARMEQIRAAIQQLSGQADPRTVARFQARFSAFPADDLTKAEEQISVAMKAEKEAITESIQQNEQALKDKRLQLNLQGWWAATVEDH